MQHEEALQYVTKDDTRIDGPYEYGKKPVKGKKYSCKDILTVDIRTLVEEDQINPY